MSQFGTYRMRIGFSGGRTTGIFTIGSSTIGGPDVFGHQFVVGYEGPYDDVTAHTTNFSLSRGRDNDTDPIPAGTLDVTLFDKNGLYNPKNELSALYGDINPLIPGLLEVQVGGVWYELFAGWLDEESARTDWGEKEAKVRFTDMFIWLDRAQSIIIPATGATNVGSAIGLILDEIEWPTLNRSLQTGLPIAGFEATGDKKGTELITGLLEADRGAFFTSRRGTPTYRDRHEGFRIAPSATFDVASAITPGISLSAIRNRSRITREGGAQQTWQDDPSIHQFGYSDWPEITSPYFKTDADALNTAKFLVWNGRHVASNIWTMNVQEGETEASLAAIAQTDLLQKIVVDNPAAEGEYIVQKIVHSGAGGEVHKMSLVLSEAPLEEAFIIGVSEVGSTEDVLVP
jgi:hypothetical protein